MNFSKEAKSRRWENRTTIECKSKAKRLEREEGSVRQNGSTICALTGAGELWIPWYVHHFPIHESHSHLYKTITHLTSPPLCLFYFFFQFTWHILNFKYQNIKIKFDSQNSNYVVKIWTKRVLFIHVPVLFTALPFPVKWFFIYVYKSNNGRGFVSNLIPHHAMLLISKHSTFWARCVLICPVHRPKWIYSLYTNLCDVFLFFSP